MESKKAVFTKEDVKTWWSNEVFTVAAKIKLMDKYNVDKGVAGNTIYYPDLLRIYKGEHGILDTDDLQLNNANPFFLAAAEKYADSKADKNTDEQKWLEIRSHYYAGMIYCQKEIIERPSLLKVFHKSTQNFIFKKTKGSRSKYIRCTYNNPYKKH